MAVTMRDIARAAQVDPSVVSAVLNGSKSIRVSEKKRELVLSLVKKMNYRPNITARSLITRKSFSVGLLFFSTRDRFYAEMMGELQTQLMHRGYVGIYAFWNDDSEIDKAYSTVLSRGVDGIITCHNDPTLIPKDTPTVIFGGYQPDFDCVQVDYQAAIRQSLAYLTGLGHRKIGFLSASAGSQRYEFYRLLLGEFGLAFNPDWVGEGSGFFSDAYEAAIRLLKREDRPTALIVKNDTAAIAAINAAGALGISVPDDLSILGFDNIEEAEYSRPPLTTNGNSIKSVVTLLINTLFERMEEPEAPPRARMMEAELIIRQSCAPPK